MTTFITQPTYLPWIGIFKAIDYCDHFVFYDDVQYERKSWQNRNRIINQSVGSPIDLAVPVKKAPQKTLIYKIEIANPLFYQDHLKKIKVNYPQNDFRSEVLDVLESVYAQRYQHLSQLTTELTRVLAGYIGLTSNFSYSRDSSIVGDKHTRPLLFARSLGTTEYLTQAGTKEYTNIAAFAAMGITVTFLDFMHPEYRQSTHRPFVPYLSVVDMLINIGPVATKKLIQEIKLVS